MAWCLTRRILQEDSIVYKSSFFLFVCLFAGSRCREVEQDVSTLKAQLVDRQAVQTENERLKLQLGSVQTQTQMEQRKADEERSEVNRLIEA